MSHVRAPRTSTRKIRLDGATEQPSRDRHPAGRVPSRDSVPWLT